MDQSHWRQKMQRASFRGVPFEIDAAVSPAGRRVAVHEYPQRDSSYPEDMGRRAREYKISAFVAGPDCFDQRDRLLEAIETPGAGELIHPWHGSIQVVPGECEVTYERLDGGLVRFALVFHEADALEFPAGTPNTSRQLSDSARAATDTGLSRFDRAVALINRTQVRARNLENQGRSLFDVVQRHAAPIAGLIGTAERFTAMLTNSPDELRGIVAGVLYPMRGAFNSFAGYQQSAQNVGEQASAIAAVQTMTRPPGQNAAALTDAGAALVQDILIVDAGQAVAEMPMLRPLGVPTGVPSVDVQGDSLARPDVPVADDILNLSQHVTDSIWQMCMTAPHEHYQSLTDIRIRVARHLAAVARQGTRITTVTPAQSIPALVLAYALYGDAARAGEIVTRNRVVHPGFLPCDALQVLAE